MKPKEIANKLMDIVSDVSSAPEAWRVNLYKDRLLMLASELTALEPSYGHAERIHKLTGGNEQ